jgi:nitrite reductase/ring-hydroxylating ferredoxin subunit
MSGPFLQAVEARALAEGGMLAVTLEDRQLVVARSAGAYFAFARRCGHMSAPLEMGSLSGAIVSCPMHCAQFDLGSGAALCGPVPEQLGEAPRTPQARNSVKNFQKMFAQVRTEAIEVHEAKLEDGWVWVRLASRG